MKKNLVLIKCLCVRGILGLVLLAFPAIEAAEAAKNDRRSQAARRSITFLGRLFYFLK